MKFFVDLSLPALALVAGIVSATAGSATQSDWPSYNRTLTSERALIEAEPHIEPGRQMEAGTDFDDESRARLAPLFTAIRFSPYEVLEASLNR